MLTERATIGSVLVLLLPHAPRASLNHVPWVASCQYGGIKGGRKNRRTCPVYDRLMSGLSNGIGEASTERKRTLSTVKMVDGCIMGGRASDSERDPRSGKWRTRLESSALHEPSFIPRDWLYWWDSTDRLSQKRLFILTSRAGETDRDQLLSTWKPRSGPRRH